MKNEKTRKLVLSSLMAAIVCVSTFIVKIPLPGNGYVHMGDCFVLLCGWSLNPLYGALAAGVGSMLADVFSGFLVYAVATFIIKALAAFLAGKLFRSLKKKNVNTLLSCIISGIAAGIIVPLGYFIFEYFAFSPEIAIVDIIGNTLQIVFGIMCATLVYPIVNKSKILSGLN